MTEISPIEQTAPMGHNMPPDPIDEVLAPYADAIAEAENWLDGEEVTNEGQMKAVDAILKQIRSANSDLAKAEKSTTAPLYDAWMAEKARWKPTVDDMKRMKDGLAGLVNAFKKKLAEEKEAERRAAEEAAWEAQEKARLALAEAEETNIDAMRAAEAAQMEAKAAQKAASKAKSEKVTGLRTVHKHEIVDMRAAVNWIAKNDKEAMTSFTAEYVRRNFRTAMIDGVKVWEDREAY